MGRLSRVAWLYIGIVVAAAVVMIAVGPFGGLDWVQVGALGLLLVACESSATLLNPRGLAWSANSIASLAAVVLCGPAGAALVGCCTLFGVRRGPSPVQRVFNAAMFAVSAYLAARAFLLFGGTVGVPSRICSRASSARSLPPRWRTSSSTSRSCEACSG